MAAVPSDGFCPTCKCQSLLNRRGQCVWCDTLVATPPATRTKTGHNVNRGVPIHATDEVLDAAIARYREGASVRQVAAEMLDRTTYANAHSFAACLYEQLRHRGVGIRSAAEQNTKHGRARRGKVDPAYRREGRRARGEVRGVVCKEQEAGYHKRPCERYALAGSDYCRFHDPVLRDEVVAVVTKARMSRAAA